MTTKARPLEPASGRLEQSPNVRAMDCLTPVHAHVMWRETNTRIDVFLRRVREGVDVTAASEFSRWLQWSGVLRLLEGCEAPMPLPVRAAELKQKTSDLVALCGEWFADHERSNSKPHPSVPKSELEAINEQLRNINATLGELTNERNASKQAIA